MFLPDKFYHVYNHANGSENLFRNNENYRFFLSKTIIHLCPILDVYAYCLLPNHFHLLIKTKTEKDFLAFPKFQHLEKFTDEIDYEDLSRFISKRFGNLFSSYTQSYNVYFNQKGSLFRKNFKHCEIDSEDYFKNAVHYIHAIPVLHGFVKHMEDWSWSSYQTILSNKKTNLRKEEVITWFGDIKQYLQFHEKTIDLKLIPEFEL